MAKACHKLQQQFQSALFHFPSSGARFCFTVVMSCQTFIDSSLMITGSWAMVPQILQTLQLKVTDMINSVHNIFCKAVALLSRLESIIRCFCALKSFSITVMGKTSQGKQRKLLESVFSLQKQIQGAKATWDTNPPWVCRSPTTLLKGKTSDINSQLRRPTGLCEKQCLLHLLQFP